MSITSSGLSRWSNRYYSHGFEELPRVDILNEVLTVSSSHLPMEDLRRQTPGKTFAEQTFLDIIQNNNLTHLPTDMRPQDLKEQGLSGDAYPYVLVSDNCIIGHISEIRDVFLFDQKRNVVLRDYGMDRILFDRSQAKLGDGLIVTMKDVQPWGRPGSHVGPLSEATPSNLEGPFVLMPVNAFAHPDYIQRKNDFAFALYSYNQRLAFLDTPDGNQSSYDKNQDILDQIFVEKNRVMAHILYADETGMVMPKIEWTPKFISGGHRVIITPWNDVFIYKGNEHNAVASTMYGTHYVKPTERGKGYGAELATIAEVYSPFSRAMTIPGDEVGYRLKKKALETLTQEMNQEYSPRKTPGTAHPHP